MCFFYEIMENSSPKHILGEFPTLPDYISKCQKLKYIGSIHSFCFSSTCIKIWASTSIFLEHNSQDLTTMYNNKHSSTSARCQTFYLLCFFRGGGLFSIRDGPQSLLMLLVIHGKGPYRARMPKLIDTVSKEVRG
jgi:hypothetical protein